MVTLSPTVASIRQAKPSYVYGAAAYPPLSTTAAALVRVGMPADIPANAQITSALLTFTQYGAYAGAVTLNLARNTAAWTMSKAAWSKAPASTASRNVAKTDTPSGTLWTFDVTADVQGFVGLTLPNFGWRLGSTSASSRSVRGSSSSTGKPTLVIEYMTPGDPPEDLSPDGNQAVSLAKPTLTFQAAPDTTAINVQIDADATGTVDWDSGDVASVSGQLDLALTTYPGLALAASTYWRARTKSGLGYSDWSPWAQFSRQAKPVVTITSPGATSDDTTPPIVWTAPGQVSWQVVITDPTGKVVANSGQIVGADTTWTPPKALGAEGSSATAEVRSWDAVDRTPTQGDPVYASATRTFVLSGTAAVAGAATVTASNDGVSPVVKVTATRANAPDAWTLIRDGVRIVTSTTTGTAFTLEDWTADPNHPHTYRMAPVTTGVGTSSLGPTVTTTPRCQGIWLIDPDNPTTRAVIWGQDAGSWDATELAVVHQPIEGAPIRRVAYRPPLSGAIKGDLVDVGPYTADAQITALYAMKSNDLDVRMVVGDRNLLVRLGDLLVNPTPDSAVDRHSEVAFSWWQQGETPWQP